MSSIKKYAVEETSVLHLKDASEELMYADGPDGQPDLSKPMRVTLYGPGSKQFAKAQAANGNKMIDKLKKKGKADQTAEEKARETAEFLTACTQSVENIDEEPIDMYSDVSIGFVAEQVNKYLGDWANFTKSSAKI